MSMNGANNASQSVTVGGDTYITHRAASTAIAPAIPPTANCALSGSVGVQGLSFGLSAGGATIDENCAAIEAAKAAHVLGKPAVAHEVLCDIPRVREARRRAGDPCAADRDRPQASSTAVPEYTDPIIRRRLGLAPR